MKSATWIAVLLVICLAVWLVSGGEVVTAATEPPAPQQADAPASSAPVRVEVLHSAAQSITRNVIIQGQVEARRVVRLKAETSGRVKELPVVRGSRVDSGTLLVALELNEREAQRQQAEAQVRQYEYELKAAETLKQKGLQADTRLMELRAQLAAARASLASSAQDIAHTRISAPIDGILDQRPLEVGDFLDRGDAVATLVDDSEVKVTAMVPQNHLPSLHLGQAASARLLDGRELQGQLSYIATEADSGSRSYRVEVSVANPEHQRLIGMSATLQLPVASVRAHLLSPALLSLNSRNQLVIKAVDARQQVAEYPVSIVRTAEDGVWLSGLPAEVEVISTGQGFVSAGDPIEPVAVTAPTAQGG
ncbi:efflux RND transporter periplasmic adaptor subunit [Pokkaliibacter plantistimulans]|nr:efflux RND transporter periplasmic adaptor subunit [Pokkaliibacter plantistimulans]